MNLVLPIIAVSLAVTFAIAALLLVRTRAPEGGFFTNGDRAAGVFGVLANAFVFLLSFIVFLAFTSYDSARAGAESEALTVVQQFETAQFFPPASGTELSAELVCYGRYVVETEWPLMEGGDAAYVNPWSLHLFRTLQTVQPDGATQESAYEKWLDLTSDREEARRDRTHGADGVIPATLWIVLILGAATLFIFMLFLADSGEHAVVQALQMGTVVLLLGASLMLIQNLNQPFHSGVGGLRPVAMERTLNLLEVQLADEIDIGPLPCSDKGEPNDA